MKNDYWVDEFAISILNKEVSKPSAAWLPSSVNLAKEKRTEKLVSEYFYLKIQEPD